jgi:hypothetical protein
VVFLLKNYLIRAYYVLGPWHPSEKQKQICLLTWASSIVEDKGQIPIMMTECIKMYAEWQHLCCKTKQNRVRQGGAGPGQIFLKG